MKRYLILEDGSVFPGVGFGAKLSQRAKSFLTPG